MKLSSLVLLATSALLAARATAAEENVSAPEDATQASAAPADAPAALPSEVDLRPKFEALDLPPRRQGGRGTCSVFTTAGAFEFALAKARGKGEPLSVEYLNWATNQVINNDRDRGQFFHDLLRGYEEYGICFESEMPYRQRFNPYANPRTKARDSASQIKKNEFIVHWIKPINTGAGFTDEQMTELKQVLASGYPVAVGASHSRLFVGYVDKADAPGGGIFYTKDSGSGRFDEVTYEFAKTEVNDAFWVDLKQVATESAPAGEVSESASSGAGGQ